MSTLFASGIANPGMSQPTATGQGMDVSPDRARLLFDASPAPQLLLNRDGRILAVNAAAARLLGLAVAELRGRCLQEWIPDLYSPLPSDTPPDDARELIARCGDGRDCPVDVRLAPLTQDGEALTIVSLVDLSPRHQAHEAQAEIHRLNAALAEQINEQAATLLQRERDLQAILDHAPAVMGYWDAQLRNRFANHAYRDWFGVEPDRLPGMHVREMLGETRYRANLPYLMGALRGEPQYFEPVVPRPEGGGARHAQAHYLPDIDEQGVVRGFYVTVIDVTPIKDAQARAEELLHFSEAIFEQSPVGMCVFTQEGSCVTANSAMAQLVGASVSQVRQLNFRQLDSWKQSNILPLADATLQDGQLRRTEIHVKSSFGREIHASISMSRVDRDGRPHLLLIAQDVTEQKQAHDELVAARDAARDAARTKSTFLANMSHEIRTPMNAIVGLSRLSLEDQLPPRSREYLDKVHSSALALMGILDEVLDYSKIEAGQMHIESAPVDLQDVLRRVSDLFSGRIEQKGLTFQTTLGPGVSPWIMGDSLRLAQVLNNLVGNAVKFTDVGSITVAIDQISDATPDQPGVLKFSVTDTGIGIDPSCQDRLFDAFTQADSSITRQYGGSGLGLTISKTLVTMMGGYIGLNSDPGVGSEFWFTLPVSIAQRPQQATEPLRRDNLPRASTLSPSPFQGRVLLAEDNRLNQIVAVEFLERMGLEVEVVDNGLEALNRLRQVGPEHFGAVLMDLHMPVMDGLEATRRIRALPTCQALPIIAMTAAALMEDRSACMDAGMVDHISKPVMPEQLYESLKKWMITPKDPEPSPSVPEDRPSTPGAPEMVGFDLPGLLTRIMGNEALMWRLLGQFADHEEHAGEQLATLMARGDLDAARNRAHDLKGSAANMGLVAVSQTAATLETALKGGRADAAALTAFQDALQDSLTQIRTRLAERAASPD